MNVTALIVDDEPLARRKLAAQIADVPWATLLGEASDGVAALDAIARLRPHVIFLDVQMPEISGVEVAAHLRGTEPSPAVVFTTAYDRYAITAFEFGAIDYLLKPFGTRRFLEAFERARSRLQLREGAAALERALAALSGGSGTAAPYDRIFVRDGNSVVPLSLHDVERIEGCDDYAMIHAAGRRHLVSLRIGTLEERLPNPPFLRVHRSHIVNLDYVDRIAGLDDSRFEVRMKNGTPIPVSRARSQELRRRSR